MKTREQMEKELRSIIFKVCGIKIQDVNISLFSDTYNIEANEMAYILLLTNTKLGFRICTESIDFCDDFKFTKLLDALLLFNEYETEVNAM